MMTTSEQTQTPKALNPLVVKAIKTPKSLSEAEIVSLAAMVIAQSDAPPEQKPPSKAS